MVAVADARNNAAFLDELLYTRTHDQAERGVVAGYAGQKLEKARLRETYVMRFRVVLDQIRPTGWIHSPFVSLSSRDGCEQLEDTLQQTEILEHLQR
jgi:hypothetical protein